MLAKDDGPLAVCTIVHLNQAMRMGNCASEILCSSYIMGESILQSVLGQKKGVSAGRGCLTIRHLGGRTFTPCRDIPSSECGSYYYYYSNRFISELISTARRILLTFSSINQVQVLNSICPFVK